MATEREVLPGSKQSALSDRLAPDV